jgi:hypothetical protein
MLYSIGYRLVYDRKIPGPIPTARGKIKFVAWDKDEPFKGILYRAEPQFIKRAAKGEENGECNFRFEVVALKIAQSFAAVEMPIEEQVILVE